MSEETDEMLQFLGSIKKSHAIKALFSVYNYYIVHAYVAAIACIKSTILPFNIRAGVLYQVKQ